MSPAREVILYSHGDCCLCQRAKAILKRVRDEHPFVLDEQDIKSDEQLERRYFDRVPVVVIDGVERFVYEVDEAEFRRLIA